MGAGGRDCFALERFHLERRRPADGEILQAEEQRRALTDQIIARVRRQFRDDARSLRAHAPDSDVGEDAAQVVLELIDEAPSIAAFEHDFVASPDQHPRRLLLSDRFRVMRRAFAMFIHTHRRT
jgi:hypothetical protein